MKMMSAAKLRRAQDAINAARPYSRALESLLKDLLRSSSEETGKSPMLYGRPDVADAEQRVLFIIVTSDRGLAGGFNAGLIRFFEARLREHYGEYVKTNRYGLITLGRRGTDYFVKRNFPILSQYPGIFAKLEFDTARTVTRDAVERFNHGDFDHVEIIYNEFKSVVSQKPTAERVLPVLDEAAKSEGGPEDTSIEYIYEPEPSAILDVLVPKHLETMIWKALLESNAAEQGARMTAMDAATRNAKELVNSLQLKYNKVRQAAITKEILEIVGGAEALAKS